MRDYEFKGTEYQEYKKEIGIKNKVTNLSVRTLLLKDLLLSFFMGRIYVLTPWFFRKEIILIRSHIVYSRPKIGYQQPHSIVVTGLFNISN